LEPLLQAVKRESRRFGTIVGWQEDQIEFAVQAYADDVVFISREVNGVRTMLEILEEFVDWSKWKLM
jgi:hypothetical protein